MRGLTFEGPGQVSFRTDLTQPTLQDPGDVVIGVLAAGLCGSDLHPYQGREPARAGVVCGHEAVGEVVEVGAEIRTVRPGDRVIVPFSLSCGRCGPCGRGLTSRCDHARLLGWGDPDPDGAVLHGCQAEYVRVPMGDGSVVAIGEDMAAPDALLLTDNLPTGWYAAQRAGVGPGSRVAVVGLGAVGQCAVVSCLALGATQVVGIDPVTSRCLAAQETGIQTCDPDDAAGLQVDVAIDAAGPAAAQRLAANLVIPGGAVSIIAVQTAESFAISPAMAYDKNLRITAGRAPVRAILNRLLPMIAAGTMVVPGELVVTHPAQSLADGPQLYRRFADREDGLIKASFAPAIG
ncbi:MAG: alcohol dehydrogenase catalytic domain-containing protein [Euzebya sp.]